MRNGSFYILICCFLWMVFGSIFMFDLIQEDATQAYKQGLEIGVINGFEKCFDSKVVEAPCMISGDLKNANIIIVDRRPFLQVGEGSQNIAISSVEMNLSENQSIGVLIK